MRRFHRRLHGRRGFRARLRRDFDRDGQGSGKVAGGHGQDGFGLADFARHGHFGKTRKVAVFVQKGGADQRFHVVQSGACRDLFSLIPASKGACSHRFHGAVNGQRSFGNSANERLRVNSAHIVVGVIVIVAGSIAIEFRVFAVGIGFQGVVVNAFARSTGLFAFQTQNILMNFGNVADGDAFLFKQIIHRRHTDQTAHVRLIGVGHHRADQNDFRVGELALHFFDEKFDAGGVVIPGRSAGVVHTERKHDEVGGIGRDEIDVSGNIAVVAHFAVAGNGVPGARAAEAGILYGDVRLRIEGGKSFFQKPGIIFLIGFAVEVPGNAGAFGNAVAEGDDSEIFAVFQFGFGLRQQVGFIFRRTDDRCAVVGIGHFDLAVFPLTVVLIHAPGGGTVSPVLGITFHGNGRTFRNAQFAVHDRIIFSLFINGLAVDAGDRNDGFDGVQQRNIGDGSVLFSDRPHAFFIGGGAFPNGGENGGEIKVHPDIRTRPERSVSVREVVAHDAAGIIVNAEGT